MRRAGEEGGESCDCCLLTLVLFLFLFCVLLFCVCVFSLLCSLCPPSGKSTLIHLLVGKLQPIVGSVVRNNSARVAVFAQHHVDGLDLHRSSVAMMMSIFPGHNEQIFRRHLGCFGITGDLALQPIKNLSGGQKSRVAFAVVTWKKPHVIILDEPTNHLDLETIDALITAIQNFGGGLLFVSHDQNFLQSVGNEFWGVSNQSVKRFDSFNASKKFSYAASNA